MNQRSAVSAINHAGILLVFPIGNRKEPASLWFHFHPRKQMRWEWDDSGDQGVADLWHLRAELSTSRQVVYTKWYQGRATYFSRTVFSAALRALNPLGDFRDSLGSDARKILQILESDSPLSTKALKDLAAMKGKENENRYHRALKELWSRLLIVAYGEVDEGAFPSLAVGATRVLFDDLWKEAFQMEANDAEQIVIRFLQRHPSFLRHFEKLKTLSPGTSQGPRKTEQKKAFIRFEDL